MLLRWKTLKTLWFGIKNNKILLGFMVLICIIAIPVFGILTGANKSESFVHVCGSIAAYFGGLVTPVVLFSYVGKRKECDFYRAMPIKRRQYFWGYFFSGLFIFFVPFTSMYFIFATVFNVADILWIYVSHLVIFFSLYCSMLMSVMFSGSVISTMITFILRNALVPSVIILPLVMAGVDGQSYFELLSAKIFVFMPIAGGYIFESQQYISSFRENILLFMLLVAFLDLIAAFLLHKFRKSETTMALAFPKSRYPYQYIVMLIFTMAVDSILVALINLMGAHRPDDSGFLSLTNPNLKYFVFFTILAATVIFVIMNMILERGSHAAFKNIRHLFIFLAGYATVLYAASFLFSFLPVMPLGFEPDYAIIRIYEKADIDSVDINSDKFAEELKTWKYIANITDDENGQKSATALWKLGKSAVVVSPNSLKELKTLIQGNSSFVYCTKDNGFSNENYYNKDLDKAKFFYLIMAKGDLESEERGGEIVVTGYHESKGVLRNGFYFENDINLLDYKDLELALQQE